MTHKIKTSRTHPLVVSSFACGAGRVGLSMCPGKDQPWSRSGPWRRDLKADLNVVERWGASVVLTLLERREMIDLDVEALPQMVVDRDMTWLWAPIPDGGVPRSQFMAQWRFMAWQLRKMLLTGHHVFVHCMGGLGRAGTIAAELLMITDDVPQSVAIDVVRGARGDAAIENAAQEAWLRRRR